MVGLCKNAINEFMVWIWRFSRGGRSWAGVQTYLASEYLYGTTMKVCIESTLLEIVSSLNIVFEASNQLWTGGGLGSSTSKPHPLH